VRIKRDEEWVRDDDNGKVERRIVWKKFVTKLLRCIALQSLTHFINFFQLKEIFKAVVKNGMFD